MSALLITAIVVLVFIVIYQIAKASELASLLKGEEESQLQTTKLMSVLWVLVFILGIFGIIKCHNYLKGMMLPESASAQGHSYDQMLLVTTYICGFVFVATHILLVYFSFKYRNVGKHKSYFYPHNNKLEILWTSVPALVLLILVVFGLKSWFTITSKAPDDAMIVEVTGKQFNWIIRYPGPDGIFGDRNFRLIDDANNPLGLDWTDNASKDDIIIENGELHLAKDLNVQLVIGSRDVIHNVGLNHFRMKMDAVPGILTTLWFTPTITTEEMKVKTGNPDFVYEIACSEMCGRNHYAMRGTVIVHTQDEFNEWLKGQKSYYSGLQGAAEEDAPDTKTQANSDNNNKVASTLQ